MISNEAGNIMVFDNEGADSDLRAEAKQLEVSKLISTNLFQKFQRIISLFGLVVSDVLIINMGANDIGRHQGSL